jgi:hypothetical protein
MSAALMLKVFLYDLMSALPFSWEGINGSAKFLLRPFLEQLLEAAFEAPQAPFQISL